MDIQDIQNLLEMEHSLPPISYDDLLKIMLVFARQHVRDYPSTLVACAYHLICEAKRYSFEKNT